jgi:hypothetical protein
VLPQYSPFCPVNAHDDAPRQCDARRFPLTSSEQSVDVVPSSSWRKPVIDELHVPVAVSQLQMPVAAHAVDDPCAVLDRQMESVHALVNVFHAQPLVDDAVHVADVVYCPQLYARQAPFQVHHGSSAHAADEVAVPQGDCVATHAVGLRLPSQVQPFVARHEDDVVFVEQVVTQLLPDIVQPGVLPHDVLSVPPHWVIVQLWPPEPSGVP